MKKYLAVVGAFLLVLGLAGSASATLIHVAGSDYTYDDVADQYWYYYSMRDFVKMTYQQQLDAISAIDLSASGFTGSWYMATLADMEALFTYSAEDILASFENLPEWTWRTRYAVVGRYDEISSPGGHYYAVAGGDPVGGYGTILADWLTFPDDGIASSMGAWVAYDGPPPGGQPPVTPEPATVLLFTSGGLFLAVFRKKFLK